MSVKEILSSFIDNPREVIEWTKKSLSLLEKETWINFFKKAWEWVKELFLFKSKTKNNQNMSQSERVVSSSTWNIDRSKVDE